MSNQGVVAGSGAVTEGGDQRAPVTFWLVAALLSAALVSSLWVVPYLPTNDGPQAVWSSHVAMHADDPLFAKQFEVRTPLIYKGFDALFEPLYALLGWRDALRAYQSVLALAWGWGVVAVASALHPRRRWAGLLGFGFALGWPFYMGFFSFTLASALALYVVALALRLRSGKRGLRVATTCLLFIVFAAHPIVVVPAGIFVALIVLTRASKAERLDELKWLALSALSLGAAAGLVATYTGGKPAIDELGVVLRWEDLRRWLFVLPRVVIAGPNVRACLGAVIMLLGLVLAVRAGRRRQPGELGVLLSALLVLLAALLLPMDLPGWQYAGPRWFPLGVALAHTLLPLERLPPARLRFAQVSVVVCAGLSIACTSWMHRRLFEDCADLVAALDEPVKRQGMLLPVLVQTTCDHDPARLRGMVPFNEPLRHAGALFAVEHGGSVPVAFAGSSFHKLHVRAEYEHPTPPAPLWSVSTDPAFFSDDRLHRATLTELGAYGMHYESVLVFGPTAEDVALFEMRGFEPELRRPGLLVAGFRPCQVAVHAHGVGLGERFEVSWGAWGLRTLLTLPVTVREASGPTRVLLNTLCGDLFVRVGRSENGPTCQGSRPDGRMRVRAERGDGASVDCQL